MSAFISFILIVSCNFSSAFNGLHQHRNSLLRIGAQHPLLSSKTDDSSAPTTVGFIGLGLMGDGMARRLLQSGCALTVWNRSKGKCNDLKKDFTDLVHIASCPSEVVSSSDITFVMLSTPEATRSVYDGPSGMLSAICEGKSIVDCATLAPADMILASSEVSSRGGSFAEGPVSGSKVPAEKGQLIFMLSGNRSLVDRIQPYLAQMGKASHFVGEEAGSATKMKLVVNSILSNMLACLAEGISMTDDCGLSTNILMEVLQQGAMASPLIALKGPVSSTANRYGGRQF